MSIERELLRRVISGTDDGVDFFIGYRLYKDIETFLTQPEQEPLSDAAVCEILLKKEWRGFVELVRIIEKAHGIGG